MTDKVSIIIPAYNVESLIFRAIESSLGQSHRNIEAVVVDDGSADGTWNIIQKYAAADSRVVAVRQENAGVSAARNRALELAGGRYAVFLDSDDWLEPDAVEQLLRIQAENPGRFVTASFNSAKLTGGDMTVKRHIPEQAALYFSAKEAMLKPERRALDICSACYKLFDLSLLRKHGIKFDEDIFYCEDGLFVHRYLASCCTELVNETRPLWNILDRPDSSTSGYRSKMLTAVTACERKLGCSQDSPELRRAAFIDLVHKTELVLNIALNGQGAPREDIALLRSKLRSFSAELRRTEKPPREALKFFCYAYLPTPLLRLAVRGRRVFL